MPSKYPVCKSTEVCAALERLGFRRVTQRGSHVKYSNGFYTVIVPMHSKDLKTGTLKSILEQARVDVDVFKKAL